MVKNCINNSAIDSSRLMGLLTLETIVIKLRPVTDSVNTLGHWVTGSTG